MGEQDQPLRRRSTSTRGMPATRDMPTTRGRTREMPTTRVTRAIRSWPTRDVPAILQGEYRLIANNQNIILILKANIPVLNVWTQVSFSVNQQLRETMASLSTRCLNIIPPLPSTKWCTEIIQYIVRLACFFHLHVGDVLIIFDPHFHFPHIRGAVSRFQPHFEASDRRRTPGGLLRHAPVGDRQDGKKVLWLCLSSEKSYRWTKSCFLPGDQDATRGS